MLVTQTGASESSASHHAPRSKLSRLPSATSVILTASAAATAWWAYLNIEIFSKRLLVLAFVSFGGLFLVMALPGLRRGIRISVLTVLTVAVLATAVVPRVETGSDIWLYAMFGRIVVEHGDNPYTHTPSDFPHDRWAGRSGLFVTQRAIYGPAFIGVTSVFAAVGRDSQLAVSLMYQISAALAVLLSLWVMHRLRAPPAALAFVALNPILIVEVVRIGHLDALIGLLVAAAVLAAARGRVLWATALLMVAVLMKLPVAIAFVGFLPWVAVRHGRRTAWRAVALAAAIFVAAYLVAGGVDALRPVLDARGYSNDANIWVALRSQGWTRYFGDLLGHLGPVGPSASISMIAVVVVAAFASIPFLDRRVPVLAVGLPIVAYLVLSTNPTAWYFCWVLPLVALDLRHPPFLLAAVAYSLIFLRIHYSIALHLDVNERGLVANAHPIPTVLHRLLDASVLWLELATAVVMVVTAVLYLRQRRRASVLTPST
jgi:hypothetical protein